MTKSQNAICLRVGGGAKIWGKRGIVYAWEPSGAAVQRRFLSVSDYFANLCIYFQQEK